MYLETKTPLLVKRKKSKDCMMIKEAKAAIGMLHWVMNNGSSTTKDALKQIRHEKLPLWIQQQHPNHKVVNFSLQLLFDGKLCSQLYSISINFSSLFFPKKILIHTMVNQILFLCFEGRKRSWYASLPEEGKKLFNKRRAKARQFRKEGINNFTYCR